MVVGNAWSVREDDLLAALPPTATRLLLFGDCSDGGARAAESAPVWPDLLLCNPEPLWLPFLKSISVPVDVVCHSAECSSVWGLCVRLKRKLSFPSPPPPFWGAL